MSDAASLSSPPEGVPRPRARRQRVQAAETGMTVLKGLARLGGRAGLTALSQHIDENPAKVHRYLVSLMAEDLVTQDAVSQQYCLGMAAIDIGLAAMRQVEPIRCAEGALLRLQERLAATCFVAVMGNMGPTIVRIEEPALPITINVRAGSVMPLLWSATGRVFLAFSEDAQLVARAEAELAQSAPSQRAHLARRDPIATLRRDIRAAGCASVRDTNLPGISAVAAPLRDYTGRVVAVLTALGATGGFDPAPDGANARAVREAADAVSAALGFDAGTP